MGEVGCAYVRIRPVLTDDERAALEELSQTARSLADGLDRYLSKFTVEPPAIERET